MFLKSALNKLQRNKEQTPHYLPSFEVAFSQELIQTSYDDFVL